jgi:GNAT superfamily N-acetyltransferase
MLLQSAASISLEGDGAVVPNSPRNLSAGRETASAQTLPNSDAGNHLHGGWNARWRDSGRTRTADGMRLIDIAVINSKRRRGLGTEVIRALQQECHTRGWTLRLQVLMGNTAERLYRKLGFEVAGEDPLRRQMVWSGAKD